MTNEITETYLRALIREKYSTIKRLMPSENQILLMNLIEEKGCVTSQIIADWYGVSIQDASTRLNVLFKNGYLDRYDHGSKTGGCEYVYQIKQELT